MPIVSTSTERAPCWKCGRKRYLRELRPVGFFNGYNIYECDPEKQYYYAVTKCKEVAGSARARMATMLEQLKKIFEPGTPIKKGVSKKARK